MWVDRFGLKDRQLHIKHEDLKDGGALARCYCDTYGGQVAKIVLNQKTDTFYPPGSELILMAAFHEVCELLLFPIALELYKFLSEQRVEELIHKVIRTLENSVWKPDFLARTEPIRFK